MGQRVDNTRKYDSIENLIDSGHLADAIRMTLAKLEETENHLIEHVDRTQAHKMNESLYDVWPYEPPTKDA